MKKFYAILCLAIASLTQLQAQAPQGFNYQATVRNTTGELITKSNVYFKFNVFQGSQTTVPVFTETHYVPTDDLGQVTLVIGEGTANTGVFSEIDWSLGSYFLGIELSINDANDYKAMGTTQLLSVPYALYAANSGNATATTPSLETVLAQNNSANNQQIKDLQDPTDAQDAVTYSVLSEKITALQDQINYLQDTANSNDDDGDGFSELAGDCNDSNPLVNPNEYEVRDGIDNNCDGEIDEGYSGFDAVQDADGNTYNFALYGNQHWTVENAEMVTYRDGTPIPQSIDDTEWVNLSTGAWCYFDNDPTKGKLYNWCAVMGIHDTDPNTPNKEFAPEGWHVPTDAEWTTLVESLIANGYNYDQTTTENKIAKSMASITGWSSYTNEGTVGNDQSQNNSSGFNVYPIGFLGSNGVFEEESKMAVFWSSTDADNDQKFVHYLNNQNENLFRTPVSPLMGFSVRFVRD